ncbi:suppressor of fused domain protein [Streptomyces hoynatensis]|uniref:Suppressor of fused domain protein n=1 Tax=Streptomyces hoynatensis TaxID=1141874 RepID=A0A3A9ZG72_9ACTN|nr:suppressor of fused domain protein [Streptomyces hoynatensis]RKN47095.1 suppressor of fused domain protein [Streptomyces hoynatensis]
MTHLLARVEERLRAALGEPEARASVTFLGAGRIEVLRFLGREEESGPTLVRYVTLGMSAEPMAGPPEALGAGGAAGAPFGAGPGVTVLDPEHGPRAELVLTLRAGRAATDGVLRPLAVLASSPQVEGVIVAPDASLDLGEPLWPGAPFTSVLVGEPEPPLPDAAESAEPGDAVRFLPLSPMTPAEAAVKRARGAGELRGRWRRHGIDPRDPLRTGVPLTG